MSTVGVISFQGDFEKHLERTRSLGADAIPVRDLAALRKADALIIPGGESTTIGMLLDRFDLIQPMRERIASGIPLLSTCAGTILLANEILGSTQIRIGGIDISVRRNAYGRQIESFEAILDVTDGSWPRWADEPVVGVFIRAPRIERVSDKVHILMEFEGEPVAVRQDNLVATTFHPELTPDSRVHEYFLRSVAGQLS